MVLNKIYLVCVNSLVFKIASMIHVSTTFALQKNNTKKLSEVLNVAKLIRGSF